MPGPGWEKPPHPTVKRLIFSGGSGLERADLLGLRALGTFTDRELNLLALLKVAETAVLDLGVVDEKISGSISGGDETEAFVRVESLHSSL